MPPRPRPTAAAAPAHAMDIRVGYKGGGAADVGIVKALLARSVFRISQWLSHTQGCSSDDSTFPDCGGHDGPIFNDEFKLNPFFTCPCSSICACLPKLCLKHAGALPSCLSPGQGEKCDTVGSAWLNPHLPRRAVPATFLCPCSLLRSSGRGR